ncbi:MAG: HEAT repeat domain-containing protein [Acidimicrobiales bacterium]
MSDERFGVVAAGFSGDTETARAALVHHDGAVRASALRALARAGGLRPDELAAATGDPAAVVRRTAAELAGRVAGVEVAHMIDDPDVYVAEMAAWALGERPSPADHEIDALVNATTQHGQPLVREAAAAALGAIGDPRGLDAIIAACSDKPAVRRRAVLALAHFEGPRVEEVLRAALEDRDWQVRQNAEDMLNPR